MYEHIVILFHEPLTPKHYLDQVLKVYPYDIEPALVYTLMTPTPNPHPSLLTLIDFIRHTRKFLLCEQELQEPALEQLFVCMCKLSQRNTSVLHTHQFHIDALFHYAHYPIQHPYTALSLDQVPFIDELHINHNSCIQLPKRNDTMKLHWTKKFPFQHISINPSQYLALAIQITDYQGILYVPIYASSLLLALSTLYQMKSPSPHNDFYLIYGAQSPTEDNSLYYDETNQVYIGLCTKHDPEPSLLECIKLIQSIYCAICLQKQDLNLPSSMVILQKDNDELGLLLCGGANSGKSELLDALIDLGIENGWNIIKVFENYGTLHILDDHIVATGSQIGAMIHGEALPRKKLYDNLSSSVLVKENHTTSYFLTPFTTYEETCHFHNVDCIVYMNKQAYGNTIQQIQALDEAKQLMKPLINPSLMKDERIATALWEEMLNTIFLNDIPLYTINNKYKKAQHEQRYIRLAQKLLKQIRDA